MFSCHSTSNSIQIHVRYISTIYNKSKSNEQYIYSLSGKGCNELLIETFYGNVIFKWQFEALKCRTIGHKSKIKGNYFFISSFIFIIILILPMPELRQFLGYINKRLNAYDCYSQSGIDKQKMHVSYMSTLFIQTQRYLSQTQWQSHLSNPILVTIPVTDSSYNRDAMGKWAWTCKILVRIFHFYFIHILFVEL